MYSEETYVFSTRIFYIIHASFSAIGVISNSLLLYTTIRSRHLRSNCNILIGACALFDVLHQCGSFPSATTIFSGMARPSMPSWICNIILFLPEMGCVAGSFTVLSIGIDRFIAVHNPSNYNKPSCCYYLMVHFFAIFLFCAYNVFLIVYWYRDEPVMCMMPSPFHDIAVSLWALSSALVNAIAVVLYAMTWRMIKKKGKLADDMLKRSFRAIVLVTMADLIGWAATQSIVAAVNLLEAPDFVRLTIVSMAGIPVNFGIAIKTIVYYMTRMRVFHLLLLLPSIVSLNILMYVNVIGKSHLQFAEKLIAQLNDRGHSVDVILGMLNSYVALKGSYGARQLVTVHFPGEESPWGAVAYHLNKPFDEKSDWERLNLEQNKFIETSAQLCDLLLHSTEIAKLLSSNKYDVALITGYEFCPFAIAHHYKISPVVSYVPTPAYYFQNYYGGLPELPLYENMIFDTRHEDRSYFATRVFETLRTFKDRYNHYRAYTSMNEKIRSKFGEDFPDVREIAKNISLDFTNSHPLLEEPRPISLRIRYIGGVGLPTPKPLSKGLNAMLNLAKKGNVIFSFGTQIEPDKYTEELQRVFINTFKRFPEYNFIWKFDGKTQMNASNVFNMEWLPQTDLLYDSRVVAFISHMGLNSFTETAFAGVPVVAIPIFTDQVHNARRAASLGTAEIVRKSEITEENLTRALQKIMYDERYQQRAKELSSMMLALPDTPQRIFLEGIEYAAKFQNLAPHYRLAGANHHFLVQTGWDVAAFLTVIFTLLTYIVAKLAVVFLRNIPVGVRGKSKTE